MSSDVPEKSEGDAAIAPQAGTGESYDVVLVHGRTDDGQGARVLRARPKHVEVGELRPLREGQPLSPNGEVVALAAREAPNVYDVKASYAPSPAQTGRSGVGPAQIATPAYRDSWERTFAAKGSRALN